MMPDRKPSDKQIVNAVLKWEQGWTVMLAAIRHLPDDHRVDEEPLWQAYEIVRSMAAQAQDRIDGIRGASVGDDPTVAIGPDVVCRSSEDQ